MLFTTTFKSNIFVSGKRNEMVYLFSSKRKKARYCEYLAFSMPFLQGGLNLRLIAVIVPVQPFANVVGGYTCHNRN